MLICAGFTSPLYPHYAGRDSSTFLLLARGILDGRIPYLDLFDHKGPVFYWMEALGYFFGGRTGVFFLQCIPLLTIAAAAQSPKAPSGTPMNIRMIVRRRQDTQDQRENVLSIFLGGITAGYILLSAYSACAPIYKTYLTDIAYDEYRQTQTGMAVIPENERGAVIAFDTVSDFYYHADILPCYRYFTLQKWLSTEKVNVYQEFMLYLIKERPLWVVIRTGDNDKILNEILTLLYSCRYSDDKYS